MYTTTTLLNQMMGYMTSKELADKSGYHINSIFRWRNGKSGMTFAALQDIAQTCGYELQLVKQQENDNGIDATRSDANSC